MLSFRRLPRNYLQRLVHLLLYFIYIYYVYLYIILPGIKGQKKEETSKVTKELVSRVIFEITLKKGR